MGNIIKLIIIGALLYFAYAQVQEIQKNDTLNKIQKSQSREGGRTTDAEAVKQILGN